MKELYDLIESLLGEAEGVGRDMNFEAPTWEGVDSFIEYIALLFGKLSVTDGEGRTLVGPVSVAAVRDKTSFHFICAEGTGLLQRLQVFVCSEDDGSPFVELTFFPEDVISTQQLRQDFVKWAEECRARLRARRYYVRYENASWKFGDTSSASGVFLVSNEG